MIGKTKLKRRKPYITTIRISKMAVVGNFSKKLGVCASGRKGEHSIEKHEQFNKVNNRILIMWVNMGVEDHGGDVRINTI